MNIDIIYLYILNNKMKGIFLMIQGISMVRIMEKNIKSTLKVSLVNCTTLEVSLVNCTPHEINLVIENGLEMAIPSSGIVARVSSMQESAGEIYSCIPIPLNRNKFGCVENLPEPKRSEERRVGKEC